MHPQEVVTEAMVTGSSPVLLNGKMATACSSAAVAARSMCWCSHVKPALADTATLMHMSIANNHFDDRAALS